MSPIKRLKNRRRMMTTVRLGVLSGGIAGTLHLDIDQLFETIGTAVDNYNKEEIRLKTIVAPEFNSGR
jgi:hypothetical protein